jgi:methionyl-tRNA formyltransferase
VAYSYLDGQPLRILECVPLSHRFEAETGTIFAFTGVGEPPLLGAGFGITTRAGDVGVIRVQGAGGKAMAAAEYLRGHPEIVGKRLRQRAEAVGR